MSEVKFTPGPWQVGFDDGSGITRGRTRKTSITTPGDDKELGVQCVIAECCSGFKSYNDLPVDANARLIAAAPDLYEALDDALAAMEHMGDVMNGMDIVEPEDEKHFPAFEKARKALKKARGDHNE